MPEPKTAWGIHVRHWMKEHPGVSYKDAQKQAKTSYASATQKSPKTKATKQTPSKKPLPKSEPKFVNQALVAVDEQKQEDSNSTFACGRRQLSPYVPGKYLSHGAMGSIYEACNKLDCDYVVKVCPKTYEDDDNEETFGRRAHDLGIGPKIFKVVRCKEDLELEMFPVFIVMEKLSGPTLEQAYPYKAKDVYEALDLYFRLLTEGEIQHNDAKGVNYMFQGTRLYLIDYGIARKWQNEPPKAKEGEYYAYKHYAKTEFYAYMQVIAGGLFSSLLGSKPLGSTVWPADQNLERKAQSFMNVTKGMKKWFEQNFKTSKNQYEFMTKTNFMENLGKNIKELEDNVPTFAAWIQSTLPESLRNKLLS